MATKTSLCSSSLSLFSSPLTIDQLIDVLDLLKRCGFPQKRWKELGLRLGLHKNTLDIIKRDSDTTYECLAECLSQWLSRADNVDSKGGATFDSLSDALKSMNENAAADKLDQEKRKAKAIDVFNNHHPLLSQSLSNPVSVAIMLQREGVITGQVLARVESASPSVPNQREVLLAAIIVAIESKYSLLQTFASVLCKFTGNIKLGTVIQKDYVEIAIPECMSREFTSIQTSYGRMLYNVHKIIKNKPPQLDDIKEFLRCCKSSLEPKLSLCSNITEILRVIEKECSLIDIELLQSLVEEFKIKKAEKYVIEYNGILKEFCRTVKVTLCLNEKFEALGGSPSLQCETVTYVFDWEPDEHMLQNIKKIVSKTSGKLAKIKYIKRGNSIIVSCSFPHSLTGALIIKLSENLELLIKNGLMKLTVGYCTIWKKQKIQKIQEPLEEEVQEIKEQPHDTKEERVARLEEKESEESTPQSVINQDILSTDTSVTIINKQLIKEMKTNKLLEETLTKMRIKEIQQLLSLPRNATSASYRIRRGMRMEIDQLQLLLTNKTGLLGQNESLIDIKREIAELQEQISLMSVHILNIGEENEEYRDVIKVNKPSPESVFIARYNYHATMRGEISFSEGEQLKIYENQNSFWWKGRSLVSGDEGVIPSSCVYSMLESLQLLEFILSVEEVSLPILQKIRTDSSSNDEKASLFLETINDDPIMISALRQDKKQHDEGVTGSVDWDSDRVYLSSPSPVQCNEYLYYHQLNCIH
uniref:SH3 domain-containing protein n=1 Tax=Amphimedon queenslandica TaxID=400682 RepID=A0A1X7T258_AMPQE